MRNALIATHNASTFEAEAENEFFAEVAYFDFGSSNLSYCSYRTPTRMSFREDGFIRVRVPLAGKGRISIGDRTAEVKDMTIVCSPAQSTLEFGPSYEQLIIRINQAVLEEDVATIIGIRPTQRLFFEPVANCLMGPARRLREIIISTACCIDASDDPIPRPLKREMEETIRLAVLYGIPNNLSDLLYAAPKLSAPWQVKKIEEWIDAHWQESVTIEKLAEVSGASVRSIFAAFKRTRGYTPMAYLRKIRLNAAREMLINPVPGISVTGVSLACNFKNTGNFAREYQRQFGEFPSHTLRRGRGGAPSRAT